MLVDLAPNVVLICAEEADRAGNLYTGPNTEDTPVIVEAAALPILVSARLSPGIELLLLLLTVDGRTCLR
jgi:hypothetical protein